MTALAVALLGLSAVTSMVNTPWADAAGKGRVTGTAAVTSGSFGVEPVVTNTSTLQGVMTFAVVPLPAYFDALNTGNLTLTGTSYSVSFVYAGIGTPTLTLVACSGGTWNQGTGVCTGGSPVTIGTWTPGSTTVVNASAAGSFPAAANGRLQIKATVGGVTLTVAATVTVTTSVSTGATRQVRAATTTNV